VDDLDPTTGTLPVTGTDPHLLVIVGALGVAGGLALVVAARRRRAS
jgi:LPXTG-motif cell wall-anchored protein